MGANLKNLVCTVIYKSPISEVKSNKILESKTDIKNDSNNTLLNGLIISSNSTTTENGDNAYLSTLDFVYDFFGLSGSSRDRTEKDIISRFTKAYVENPLVTLRLLFYFRDIRGGQGERRLFRVCYKTLAQQLGNVNTVIKNLKNVVEFGRWDDLFVLLECPYVRDEVFKLVEAQLVEDLQNLKNGNNVSNLGKWLPSENASNYFTKQLAKCFTSYLGLTPKLYRKMLTALRNKINIVETNLTKGDYSSIDYSKLPSKAHYKYRRAFAKNDQEIYNEFLKKVKNHEVTIKADALYPYEIVRSIFNSGFKHDETLDAQWNALPNYCSEENSLVMADVSGSMYTNNGLPISVSVSLAIYMSERNKGPFNNYFMTFSGKPALVKVVGNDISSKVFNVKDANWDMNTDFDKAFSLILDTAIKNKVPNEDMPKKLYVISDMQFDSCTSSGSKTAFDRMKKRFESAGYTLPLVVFWCVNNCGNVPITIHDSGAILISGFSPSILKYIMNGKEINYHKIIEDIVNSERYLAVNL